jgi:hypothetical protein
MDTLRRYRVTVDSKWKRLECYTALIGVDTEMLLCINFDFDSCYSAHDFSSNIVFDSIRQSLLRPLYCFGAHSKVSAISIL